MSGATGYGIEVLTGSAWKQIIALSGTSTTYSVPNLTASTSYEFRVGATNAGGTTWASPQTVATPAKVTPPAAPVLSVVNTSATQVKLSWGAVSGATSYTIFEWVPFYGWQSIGIVGSGTTSVLVNFTNDTSFYITATNSAGTSSSNQVWAWL